VSRGEPYNGTDLREMELAIYRGHGVSASAGIRQLQQAQADATDAARLRSLAATFDSHLNRDQTYTGAQVAAMLRDGGE